MTLIEISQNHLKLNHPTLSEYGCDVRHFNTGEFQDLLRTVRYDLDMSISESSMGAYDGLTVNPSSANPLGLETFEFQWVPIKTFLDSYFPLVKSVWDGFPPHW